MEKSIELKNVTKTYFRGPRYYPTLREWVWNLAGGKKIRYKTFVALDRVSLTIRKGESVGLVGSNGAGKSTILKLVSKVTKPNSGRIWRQGKVAGLLELGAGFHPELTGRENIVFSGVILGNSKAEMNEKFDEIVDFSGIEDALDMPVKHYSSGMFARLGFSVAIHTDPDILLVDEVLSVGDESFRNKCIAKIKDYFESKNKTVVFVSHNLEMIEQLCDRALWIEGGKIVDDGKPKKIIRKYKSTVADET